MQLIHSDGSTEEAKLPENENEVLTFLQSKVKGLIQYIYFTDGRQMIVNEEGLVLGLDPNLKATEIVKQDAPDFYWPGVMIAGDVLILNLEDVEALK